MFTLGKDDSLKVKTAQDGLIREQNIMSKSLSNLATLNVITPRINSKAKQEKIQ